MDYVTYKRVDGSQNDYIEVDTVGSNQQNPIGFMFGPLPTYKDVRKYVKEKNIAALEEKAEPQEQTADSIEDEKKAKIERVLQDENVNVIATEKSIDVIEEDGTKENISDAADVQSNSVNRLLNIKPKTPAPQTSEVETITYTPKGKQKQTYTVKGNKFFNSKGVEVFKENSADRNKLSGNLAVQRGEAQVVEYRDKKYLVNKDNKIMSVTTGKIMQWGEENGDRKAVLQLTQPTQSTSEAQSELSETEESVILLDAQLKLDLFKAISDEYSALTNYWDSTMKDKEKMDKLRQNNILSLADMIKDYKAQGQDQTEEEYIESLGCL